MTTPTAPVGPVEEKNFNLGQEFSNAAFGFSIGDELTNALADRTGVPSIDNYFDGIAQANGLGDSENGVNRTVPGHHSG